MGVAVEVSVGMGVTDGMRVADGSGVEVSDGTGTGVLEATTGGSVATGLGVHAQEIRVARQARRGKMRRMFLSILVFK